MASFEDLYQMLPKPPHLWSCSDVAVWLCFIRLKSLISAFASCGVDGSCIDTLELEDLENELGVVSTNSQKKLMKWFKQTLKEYEYYVAERKEEGKKQQQWGHSHMVTQRISSAAKQKTQKQAVSSTISYQLIVTPYEDSNEVTSQFYKMKHQEMSIGRSPNCNMVIREETVSSNHAFIRREGGKVYLEDQGSRNGTYIRAREREFLSVGDLIEMGSYLFEVQNIDQDLKELTMLYSGCEVQGNLLKVQLDESKQSFSIGRSCENDLFFNDSHMSGKHTRIYLLKGRFVVQDLDSTNGTWRRLSRPNQKSAPQLLNHKTIFKVGNTCSYICDLGCQATEPLKKKLSNECFVCTQGKVKNGLALPCRHLVSCFECLLKMGECLLCGTPVKNPLKVYS